MPKLDKPLTETRVNALKFPKDYKSRSIIFWDSAGMQRFGVRMMASGIKTYIILINKFGSTPFAIGRTDILTLEEAKERAKKMLLDAEQDIHPNAPDDRIVLATLSENYIAFREHDDDVKITTSTLTDYKHQHKSLTTLAIGSKIAENIDSSDIAKMMREFDDHKNKANKMRGHISRVLRWAMVERYIPEKIDPTSLVKKKIFKPYQPRFKEDEPAKIIQYLEAVKRDEILDAQGRRIDKMWVTFTYCILLSGARPMEIASARLDELDEALHALIKKDHKTKRTKEEKPIYLIDKAWDELEHYIKYERPKRLASLDMSSSAFIFPSQAKEGHVTNWDKFYGRMKKVLDIEAPLYASRRNFAKIGKRVFEGDRERISKVTGHETLEMIDTYAGEDEILINRERKQAAKDNTLIAQHIITASMNALHDKGR
jgi:integrase